MRSPEEAFEPQFFVKKNPVPLSVLEPEPPSNPEYDFIESLVVKDSGIELNGKDFLTLCSHGVYLFLDGDYPLYVGRSNNVMSRASSIRHHAGHVREKTTRVKMWTCPDAQAAEKLEHILIDRLKPTYNKRGLTKRVWTACGFKVINHDRLFRARNVRPAQISSQVSEKSGTLPTYGQNLVLETDFR